MESSTTAPQAGPLVVSIILSYEIAIGQSREKNPEKHKDIDQALKKLFEDKKLDESLSWPEANKILQRFVQIIAGTG